MAARILVVEDTVNNLELMRYLLQARGHTVVDAPNGGSAVEIAVAEKPDLILMDMQLPDIPGDEAFRRIRQVPGLDGVPVVAVTSFAMVGDRERILGAGFDGYLSKPLEPHTFAETVEAYLPPGLRGRASEARQEVPAPTPAAPAPGPAAEPGRGSGVTILVVDDLDVNLILARRILEPSGFRVVTASTIGQALHAAREDAPDLVLSDIHLGGQSGYDLLVALRGDEELQSVPFAFLSASVKSEREVAELRAQSAEFISRPIDPRELIEKVRELVGSGSQG